MILVNANVFGHLSGCFFVVATEHNRFTYPLVTQCSNSLSAVGLHAVSNQHMTCIRSFNSHIDDCAYMVFTFCTLMYMCSHALHHFFVSNAHPTPIDQSRYSFTRSFFYLFYFAAIMFLRIGCTQSNCNRVSTKTFNMGREM